MPYHAESCIDEYHISEAARVLWALCELNLLHPKDDEGHWSLVNSICKQVEPQLQGSTMEDCGYLMAAIGHISKPSFVIHYIYGLNTMT